MQIPVPTRKLTDEEQCIVALFSAQSPDFPAELAHPAQAELPADVVAELRRAFFAGFAPDEPGASEG